MSLSTSDVQRIFKVLGKGVFLAALGATHATAYEKILMAIAAQINGGTDASFGAFQDVVVPTNTSVKLIITKVQGAADSAKTTNENFLTKVVAPTLGLDSSASIVGILDALRGQMVTNTQYILSGGLFDVYVRATWSYTAIPIAGSLQISEGYVTDSVV